MTPAAKQSPRPALRTEWRLRDSTGEWTIVRGWDARENEPVLRDPPVLASLLLGWTADSFARIVLLDLCDDLWEGGGCRPEHPRLRSDLLARLDYEFRSGRLVLIAPHPAETKTPAATPAAPASRSGPASPAAPFANIKLPPGRLAGS